MGLVSYNYVLLSLFFTCMIIHGYCPIGMITGTMIQILKIKGTVNSDHFRFITLSSLLGKMFDLILLKYFKEELMSSQSQFGFKPNSLKPNQLVCTRSNISLEIIW